MKRIAISFTLTLLCTINVNAQNNVNNHLMSWWNIKSHIPLSEKISISPLYSWRRSDFVKNWQQSLLRIGFDYKITENLTLTPGYDWVITFPYGKQPISKMTTEYRIFEQIMIKQVIGKINLKHRYRFEQRMFENKISKHRFRYLLVLSMPIYRKLSITLFDELFVNYGTNMNNHFFDQNWMYIGFNYPVNGKLTLSIGCMEQYILKPNNLDTERNPSVQIGIKYNFNEKNRER